MSRNLFILFIGLLYSVVTFADVLKSEQDARQLSDKVMAQAAKGDISAAFALMKPFIVISESEFQGIALQSKSQREQIGIRYG